MSKVIYLKDRIDHKNSENIQEFGEELVDLADELDDIISYIHFFLSTIHRKDRYMVCKEIQRSLDHLEFSLDIMVNIERFIKYCKN